MLGTYVTTQIINAVPMTRGEYNKFRGWKIPKNENPEDAGYMVQNVEFKTQSWTPKQLFEASSFEVESLDNFLPYQQRLLGERAALSGNLRKLDASIKKPTFLNISASERELLISQSRAMAQYLSKLNQRIAIFYEDPSE